MFTANLNNEVIFTSKNESGIRTFCRDRLKTEEHLGEILFIYKDKELRMVFSSERSGSGNIRMKDVTSKYQTSESILDNKVIKEEKIEKSEKSDNIDKTILYVDVKNVQNTSNTLASKHPRWEIYWKNADGHTVPLSTIVGLEWFTMDDQNPKEHQWMEEHGYDTNILNSILNLPINQEFSKDHLSDEWGEIQKIKRLR